MNARRGRLLPTFGSTAGQLQVTVPPETSPILLAGLNAAAHSSTTGFPVTGDYQTTYSAREGRISENPIAPFDLVSGMRSKGSLTPSTSSYRRCLASASRRR